MLKLAKKRDINEVTDDCLNDLSPKKVLDLGIGNGRCSKRFLQKGSVITGIDLENPNILGINFIEKDITNFDIKENYDLIIASFVLHFLNLDISKKIVEKMKESTEFKGYNFILTMNKKDDSFKAKKDNFFLNGEDLKELYFDWDIIKIGDFETDFEEHGGLKPHKHNVSFILARKVSR